MRARSRCWPTPHASWSARWIPASAIGWKLCSAGCRHRCPATKTDQAAQWLILSTHVRIVDIVITNGRTRPQELVPMTDPTTDAPASADPDAALRQLRGELQDRPPAVLVDGRWQPAAAVAPLEVDDPATGQPIATIAAGDEADIDLAVAAARRAFREGPWPRMPAWQRAALLLALADAIEAQRDRFALLESLDAGHAIASIRDGDLPLGLRALRECAGWATKLAGEVPMRPAAQPGMDYYLREPVGVAGLITPWNAPFLMVLQKLGAALATGCTAVVKPAELAPLT